MEADVLVKATKVEGVYTSDPAKDPDAEFIPRLSFHDVLTRELGVMDAAAVSLCKDNDLPIIVLNIQHRGAVIAALRGESMGTLVS
jgi:uridylate kinase